MDTAHPHHELKPASLSQQIAEHIEALIINGVYEQGSKLNEQSIALELGVSSNKLREALVLLERTHLVELLPRRGVRVVQLELHKVDQLYQAFFVVLAEMGAGAAGRYNPSENQRRLNDMSLYLESQSYDKFQTSAFGFIGYILRNHQNWYMNEAVRNLLPLIRWTSRIAFENAREELPQALNALQSMHHLLEQGQGDQVRKAIIDYGKYQYQLIKRSLNEGIS